MSRASAPPAGLPAGRAVLAVLAAAVLFGTTGTAQALGPDGTTPLGVGAVRLGVGGLALLLVLPVLGGRTGSAVALWRTPLGLLAGACTALYQVCFFAGVERAGVALGTLVTIGSGPVFAGLLAALLLREPVERSWLLATGTSVAGLALLLLAGGTGAASAGPAGLLLALGSGAAYAAYTVAAKQLMTGGAPTGEVMASAFGLGGVLLLPLLLTQPLGWLTTPAGAALAAYLGLGTTSVAYLLFGRGLAVLPAGPVTTLVLAEPVVATALAVGLLGERLTVLGVAGAALVLVGLAMQGVAASRRRPVRSRTATAAAGRDRPGRRR